MNTGEMKKSLGTFRLLARRGGDVQGCRGATGRGFLGLRWMRGLSLVRRAREGIERRGRGYRWLVDGKRGIVGCLQRRSTEPLYMAAG